VQLQTVHSADRPHYPNKTDFSEYSDCLNWPYDSLQSDTGRLKWLGNRHVCSVSTDVGVKSWPASPHFFTFMGL